MEQTNRICRSYRISQNMSLRRFADALNERLVNTDVSFGTVNRWEDEVKPYEPDMRLLFECIATYRDWRAAWAVDCLKAMWPDLVDNQVITFNITSDSVIARAQSGTGRAALVG